MGSAERKDTERLLAPYNETIDHVVRSYKLSSTRLSAQTLTRDDVISILRVAVWRLVTRIPDAPERYVHKAIWNKARDLYKESCRAERRRVAVLDAYREQGTVEPRQTQTQRMAYWIDLERAIAGLSDQDRTELATATLYGEISRSSAGSIGLERGTLYRRVTESRRHLANLLARPLRRASRKKKDPMSTLEPITPENIHTKKDDEIKKQISCFGRMWNPFDLTCRSCAAQARCLHNLALIALPQEALERGARDFNPETGILIPRPDKLDAIELAHEFGTEARALSYALAYAKDTSTGLPVLQTNGTLTPSFKGPPQIGLTAGEVAASKEVVDATIDSLVSEAEVKKTKPSPKAKPAKATPKVKASPVKKTPVKPAVKASAPVKVAKPAPKVKPKGKKAALLSADDQARFQEDRARYATVPDGATLYKSPPSGKHKGKTFAVALTSGGWSYDGSLFPTLYSVMVAIEGKAPSSAAQYFVTALKSATKSGG